MSAERSQLATRYKRLEEGIPIQRRAQIIMAEIEALRRRERSVFDLLQEDTAMRERLMRGPGAFKRHELTFIAEVE